jgi:hypothetical protein
MRDWDLTAGMAKLELAMHSLGAAGSEVAKSWSDQTNREFQETYLAPLEPMTRTVFDAIRRLAEVLACAERQCGIN